MKPFFLLLLVSVIFFAPGYCQDSPESRRAVIIPFRPSQENNFEYKVQQQIPIVENFDFRRYVAVAGDDLSVCNSQNCRTAARSLLDARYMAEGRCSECGVLYMKEICKPLQTGNCNTLQGRNKTICELLMSGSSESVDSFLAVADRGTIKSDLLEFLGAYHGFKNYSVAACNKYFGPGNTVPLTELFMCKIMFSSDPEAQVRTIIRDLAIFNVARGENRLSDCDFIHDIRIKNACKNPKIGSIAEIR